MLASTEKRLGLIAASALTAASLLLISQQPPMTTYEVTYPRASIAVEQVLAATAMPITLKW